MKGFPSYSPAPRVTSLSYPPSVPFPFDNSYARLPEAFSRPVDPTPVRAPLLIKLNRDLAAELGADVARLESPEGLAILSGNAVPAGAEPLAMAYSGHQFGGFSLQLGDGRAILLGEVVDKNGIRRDIQLKGSGPTPFSRRGDGRSALGPVLREYILSEAMAALGVPTTRALAAVASGETVVRDGIVPGGVFTRVARSHIRIGTFEYFAARGDTENLRLLADHVIARHYPDAATATNPYRALLEGVIVRQADLVAHWMQFGFIHGVMNTDNMSLSGDTIDYGPCAFLDNYHPAKTFSSIDHHGRYAFANQGSIAHWNLTRLAETLLPLLAGDREESLAAAEAALARFPGAHGSALRKRLLAKIGIDEGDPEDADLVENLLSAMTEGEADFTLTFRHFSGALESGNDQPVIRLFKEPESIVAWLERWRARLPAAGRHEAIVLKRRSTPVFIPRNHRIEEAIVAGNGGDFEPFHRLHHVLQFPFTVQPGFSEYELAPRPGEVVQETFCGT